MGRHSDDFISTTENDWGQLWGNTLMLYTSPGHSVGNKGPELNGVFLGVQLKKGTVSVLKDSILTANRLGLLQCWFS